MISSRDPDITGPTGKAWDISEMAVDETQNSVLAAHVLEYNAPDGNIMHYYAGLIHLRKVPPSDRHYDSAAYEFAIYLINPNSEVNIDKADKGDFSGVQILPDPTIACQFNGIDIHDKEAVEIEKEVIAKLFSPPKHPKDRLNPEKDYNENFCAKLSL